MGAKFLAEASSFSFNSHQTTGFMMETLEVLGKHAMQGTSI